MFVPFASVVLDQDITGLCLSPEGLISVLASVVSLVDAKTELDDGWGRRFV